MHSNVCITTTQRPVWKGLCCCDCNQPDSTAASIGIGEAALHLEIDTPAVLSAQVCYIGSSNSIGPPDLLALGRAYHEYAMSSVPCLWSRGTATPTEPLCQSPNLLYSKLALLPQDCFKCIAFSIDAISCIAQSTAAWKSCMPASSRLVSCI